MRLAGGFKTGKHRNTNLADPVVRICFRSERRSHPGRRLGIKQSCFHCPQTALADGFVTFQAMRSCSALHKAKPAG
ncbi:hypothetical protein [Tardiphaga sp.]|uniref:hypothetical protein n=1 Tax=Tardiphaga sp. TaxID=1926292 RepID=UPI0026366944|nr:hypothetical protein [Tardiphaga sp.]